MIVYALMYCLAGSPCIQMSRPVSTLAECQNIKAEVVAAWRQNTRDPVLNFECRHRSIGWQQ